MRLFSWHHPISPAFCFPSKPCHLNSVMIPNSNIKNEAKNYTVESKVEKDGTVDCSVFNKHLIAAQVMHNKCVMPI